MYICVYARICMTHAYTYKILQCGNKTNATIRMSTPPYHEVIIVY